MQPYAEVEGARFGSPLAFCLWEALGGGGRGSRERKKKVVASEATLFFFFFFLSLDPPPPPQQPRVLFAYSFTLLKPFSSPIRKLLIAHAFPQIHDPPYPPFIIVLLARNLSGRIAASKNLKNHTYAKMGAPQRPFLIFYYDPMWGLPPAAFKALILSTCRAVSPRRGGWSRCCDALSQDR